VLDYINSLYSIPNRIETQLILKQSGFSAQAVRNYTDP
jgi:hypothetical protein